MVSASPVTPPPTRRIRRTRAPPTFFRTPAYYAGLATPPPSVHKHGQSSNSSDVSPGSSIADELDGIDVVAPAQPSLSCQAPAVTSSAGSDAVSVVVSEPPSNPFNTLAPEVCL